MCDLYVYIVTWQPMFLFYFLEFAENGSIYDYLHKKHKEPTLKQNILWAKEVTEGKFINF